MYPQKIVTTLVTTLLSSVALAQDESNIRFTFEANEPKSAQGIITTAEDSRSATVNTWGVIVEDRGIAKTPADNNVYFVAGDWNGSSWGSITYLSLAEAIALNKDSLIGAKVRAVLEDADVPSTIVVGIQVVDGDGSKFVTKEDLRVPLQGEEVEVAQTVDALRVEEAGATSSLDTNNITGMAIVLWYHKTDKEPENRKTKWTIHLDDFLIQNTALDPRIRSLLDE